MCTIVCLPRSWCKPQSLRWRTSSESPGTSDEAGSLSQRWWRPASPERWCATILEMLTTVPVSSLSLTGLPSPNWTHPWRESLLSPWWRGVDLAGLLEMPTRHLWQNPLRNCDPVGPAPGPLAPYCGSPSLDRMKTESSPLYQRSHEHQHAEKPA